MAIKVHGSYPISHDGPKLDGRLMWQSVRHPKVDIKDYFEPVRLTEEQANNMLRKSKARSVFYKEEKYDKCYDSEWKAIHNKMFVITHGNPGKDVVYGLYNHDGKIKLIKAKSQELILWATKLYVHGTNPPQVDRGQYILETIANLVDDSPLKRE